MKGAGGGMKLAIDVDLNTSQQLSTGRCVFVDFSTLVSCAETKSLSRQLG